MREWTEQEEQEMIELAKQGDPRANYELSLWALRRSEEEPGEARWNRLAAKCLVKAAQAGYPPAQKRMSELLHQDREKNEPKPAPEEESVPPEPVRLSDARAARRSQGPAPESTARRPARREPEPEDDGFGENGYEDDEDGYGAPRRAPRRKAGRSAYTRSSGEDYDDEPDGGYEDKQAGGRAVGAFANWNEKQWRRMEIICVAVCAILLVAIAVMIITSRGGSRSSGDPNSAIPAAGDASAGTTSEPTPEPAPYPDEAAIAAIKAADLEVYPEENEYVTVATTATVKVDSQQLRLRKGPSTTFQPPICNMADGTTVQVYAIKNNWSLVYYEGGEEGPVYGWCSSEYLIVTSGAADNSSVG